MQYHGLAFPASVYVFKSPASYTGEDLIEFHIPGNPLLAEDLLQQLRHHGARSAEPGEFTARAYFNGKMDLTRAEGVAAVIAAGNDSQLQAARQLLAGELANRLRPLLDQLAQTLALVEVGIDFVEEDVTFLPAEELHHRIDQIDHQLADLVQQSSRFASLNHAPRVVLTGRPNAGKSSLLNALTGESRAVISPTAGTTRDVLSAPLNLPRGQVLLIDAAGLETATDEPLSTVQIEINQAMQSRARSAVESADCLLLVQDATDDRPPIPLPRPVDIVVKTKLDLLPLSTDVTGHFYVSVVTSGGLAELKQAISDHIFSSTDSATALVLNTRHLEAIRNARSGLAKAIDITIAQSPELIANDLRAALDALGSILGEVSTENLLGRIFSAFCIGK